MALFSELNGQIDSPHGCGKGKIDWQQRIDSGLAGVVVAQYVRKSLRLYYLEMQPWLFFSMQVDG
ncbi:hypothetical protein CUN67_11785 [Pantoea cypripedii]|uniref:Uncharacterized protein n=1 Tax=Pantoea cypripedii TaxID=55209 RepID=A0A6B9G2X6_PANCY|nr:hypothetical protein CUN67_11785 [Pantoea cypripedii]